MPIFIFVEYVEQILGSGGEGTFNTPPICEQARKVPS